MENKDKVKSIIKNLMEQLYEAKNFDKFPCSPLDCNIFEAEMKDLWEEAEAFLELTEDYAAQIENLEERLEIAEFENIDLIDNNYILAQENDKLREILGKVSEAVNDTWY